VFPDIDNWKLRCSQKKEGFEGTLGTVVHENKGSCQVKCILPNNKETKAATATTTQIVQGKYLPNH
jgi:hypothetical protein